MLILRTSGVTECDDEKGCMVEKECKEYKEYKECKEALLALKYLKQGVALEKCRDASREA